MTAPGMYVFCPKPWNLCLSSHTVGCRSPDTQDLEYPGFEVEDQVWNRLLELRGSKIRKELELRKQHRLFAIMKRKLEALQADCDSVDSQVHPSWKILLTFFSRGTCHLSRLLSPPSLFYPFEPSTVAIQV